MTQYQRLHIFITGRVQGVSFRAFTQEVAKSAGVHGWVKNLPDGRVEAVLEGSAEVLEHLVTELRAGPPGAAVSAIEIKSEESPERLRSFQIVR